VEGWDRRRRPISGEKRLKKKTLHEARRAGKRRAHLTEREKGAEKSWEDKIARKSAMLGKEPSIAPPWDEKKAFKQKNCWTEKGVFRRTGKGRRVS